MKNKLIEAFGWIGALSLVLAFALSSFYVIPPSSAGYQVLNLIGALGIITVSLHKKNYQPFALNVIWGTVALIALINILK